METVWIVEEERQALLRIMATVIAMACRTAAFTSPFDGEGRREASGGGAAPASALPSFLPRLLYRALLKILRPAEFAARRIVIAFARDIKLPPPKPLKPDTLAALHRQYRALGLAIPWDPKIRMPIRKKHLDASNKLRMPVLPLFDPLPTFGRKFLMRGSVPCITFGGPYERQPIPRRPTPNDAIATTRIGQRISAVIAALEDMPKHALRYARWRERMRVGRAPPGVRPSRLDPLRPGTLPGSRSAATREVHQLLKRVQPFAYYAVNYPDDS